MTRSTIVSAHSTPQSRRRNALSVVSVFGVGCLILAGCSGDSESIQQSSLHPVYEQQLTSFLQTMNLTDLDRAILEDRWISDEEWNELVNLYMTCMANHGLEGSVGSTQLSHGTTLASQDTYAAKFPDEDPLEVAERLGYIEIDCAADNIAKLGHFYFEPRTNPEAVDFVEATRRCLVKHGQADHAALLDGVDFETYHEAVDMFDFTNPDVGWCVETKSYGDWEPVN